MRGEGGIETTACQSLAFHTTETQLLHSNHAQRPNIEVVFVTSVHAAHCKQTCTLNSHSNYTFVFYRKTELCKSVISSSTPLCLRVNTHGVRDFPVVFQWPSIFLCGPAQCSRYNDSTTAWKVRGQYPGGGGICACPARPWDPPNLLCNGKLLSFPGLKRQGVALTNRFNLEQRLKKDQNYTSTPLLDLHGLFQG